MLGQLPLTAVTLGCGVVRSREGEDLSQSSRLTWLVPQGSTKMWWPPPKEQATGFKLVGKAFVYWITKAFAVSHRGRNEAVGVVKCCRESWRILFRSPACRPGWKEHAIV